MRVSTRRAGIMRRAVLDGLDLWMRYEGGPGHVGLYWRTYNRVRDEQVRRRNVAALAKLGRRNFPHRGVDLYVPLSQGSCVEDANT